MGQVKNLRIKNLTKSLIEKYPDKFKRSFDKNKGELDKLMSMESKKIRNMVAGYLVHEIRKKEKTPGFEMPYQKREERQRRRWGGRRRR